MKRIGAGYYYLSLFVLCSCREAGDDATRIGDKSADSSEALSNISEALSITQSGELLPTGARITPERASGARLLSLNPHLPEFPEFTADHPVSTALSPDGRTLLILTTGYNRTVGTDGTAVPSASDEYVFMYDVSGALPVQRQVLQVPNTFTGIAWNPNGREFYVTGGVDDNIHVYASDGLTWNEDASIPLGHGPGNGLLIGPQAAGVAVNSSGTRIIVTNYENDSISLIDANSRIPVAELDLRPGKNDTMQGGIPGGEYPFAVAIRGDSTAYVSSQRDNEVVVVDLANDIPTVQGRITVGSQPNRLLLNRDGTKLFVANANDDTVMLIDTATQSVTESIRTLAPAWLFANRFELKGANPDAMALSPDETTLYVTNGGTNSVAIVRLGHEQHHARRFARERSRVVGLIPTGWYPNSITMSQDGRQLFVVNGKSNAGPNPKACRDTLSTATADLFACRAENQYVWQLEKGSFLTLPVPTDRELPFLTAQVARNNHFPGFEDVDSNTLRNRIVMRNVARRIEHVIYVIKENRTYDQVLGDLPRGDGDPNLALFPQSLTPNHHAVATQFVTLDRFLDSGETSGVGWNWTVAARTTDSIEKTQPPNYANRGLSYDWEGTNRNINVGLPTTAMRVAANPYNPTDPDLLPGTSDVASHETDAAGPAGYLWDAALEMGLSVRNYGCFGDLARYSIPSTDPAFIPLDRAPSTSGTVQFIPAKESLIAISAPFFRGYDQKYPDFYRYKEWEREFDGYVAAGELPNLEFVRLPHDHFGNFTSAIDGVSTPDTQMADNDYAVGLLIEKVSHSPFARNTVVFVIEDDAQDGPDHVDAHRSIALVAGAHVKRGALVTAPHNTVEMVRTIEELLELGPMGLTDGLAEPMGDLFDWSSQSEHWDYVAHVPDVLRSTALPLPAPANGSTVVTVAPRQSAAYWAFATRGQNFDREDDLDSDQFNRSLWRGLRGASAYPSARR